MHAATLVVFDGLDERRVSASDLARSPAATDAAALFPGRRGSAVPVASILHTSLPWVTVSSSDGTYTASIPSGDLHDGGYLIVGPPDDPLSHPEGGPVRLLVADGDTLCWNVKHVASLVATEARQPDSVPDEPPH